MATGHFSMPHDPHFKGEESFKGKYIHAHDFIDGKLYKGQRVLCIGGSYSAEDIALQVFYITDCTMNYIFFLFSAGNLVRNMLISLIVVQHNWHIQIGQKKF